MEQQVIDAISVNTARHPAARMRPDTDYVPGDPEISGSPGHKIYRIRSAKDALELLSRDDAGGVTQNSRVLFKMLREAGAGGPERYEDVHEIWGFAWAQGQCPVSGQPARHDPMVEFIKPYFDQAAVDKARPAIRQLAAGLLDELLPEGDGVLDLATYARRLALRSSAVIAGYPMDESIETAFEQMFDKFTLRDSVAVLPAHDPAERAFVDTLLATDSPGLIRDLNKAESEGVLSHVECIAMVRGTLYAGTDTTGATLATMLALFGDPDYSRFQEEARSLEGAEQQKWLRDCAVETARLHPSFPEIPMLAYKLFTLPSGTTIPKGSQILLVVPAVNRDPLMAGDDPDVFRPRRRRRRSLSFGRGLHACAGQNLALAVVTEGALELLDRTSRIRLPENGWLSRSGLVTYIARAQLVCTAA